MQIRITCARTGETTTITIEGRLGIAEASELLKKCSSIDEHIRLQLSGLRSIDNAGVLALQLLRDEGAELVDASPYVERLLKDHTTAPSGTDSE